MKKKLMMVAVLMGALTLSACVDNNETQSVTDVRNAKVAQLKARAEMNNAEADAAKVLAAAEAQLMNAKAAAAKANAAKVQAETSTIQKQKELVDLQKAAAELENEAALIENQKAQAALEEALSDLEVAKKNAEAELARIAAELETNKLLWEAALADAQKDLMDAKEALADELADDPTATEKLEELVAAYSQAITNLIEAQRVLTSEKSDLVALEEDLISEEEYKAQEITDNNNLIALYEAQIAAYKEYANYMGDADVETLKAEFDKLEDELSILRDKRMAANKAYNNVSVDYAAANEANNAFWNNPTWNLICNKQFILEDGEGNQEYFSMYNYWYSLIDYIPNVDWNNFTWFGKEYNYNDYAEIFGDSLVAQATEMPYDIRTTELAFNDQINYVNNNLEMYEEWLADAQAQYDGQATEVIGYDEEGEPILKDIRNAVDSVAFLKDAYEAETDEAKKYELRNLYEQAINNKVNLESVIEYYSGVVADNTKQITVLEGIYDMLANWDESLADMQAAVDAYNEAQVDAYAEKVEAWKAYVDLDVAYSEKEAEYYAVSEALYGSNATGAVTLQSYVQEREQWIAEYKAANEDLSYIESIEQAIEYCKTRIAALEAVVAARQVAVNNAKAELDAAMAEE